MLTILTAAFSAFLLATATSGPSPALYALVMGVGS